MNQYKVFNIKKIPTSLGKIKSLVDIEYFRKVLFLLSDFAGREIGPYVPLGFLSPDNGRFKTYRKKEDLANLFLNHKGKIVFRDKDYYYDTLEVKIAIKEIPDVVIEIDQTNNPIIKKILIGDKDNKLFSLKLPLIEIENIYDNKLSELDTFPNIPFSNEIVSIGKDVLEEKAENTLKIYKAELGASCSFWQDINQIEKFNNKPLLKNLFLLITGNMDLNILKLRWDFIFSWGW